MDWTHILVTIFGGIISALIGGIFRIKLTEDQRRGLDWALEKGVSAAAERLRGASPAAKQGLAIRTAESLAPKAMAKLTAEQKEVVIDATYAKMRPSLPHATAFSLAEGEVPHPLERYRSSPPSKEPPP